MTEAHMPYLLNGDTLWYNTGVNHIKSDGLFQQRRHPFSTDVRGIDTMPHSIPNPTELQSIENWRNVVGYEGRYIVSDQGRVRSLDSHAGSHKGRVLSQPLSSGYPYVQLFKDGKGHAIRVHRLVAAAFIGPCPSGETVNHKDCDKTNNCIENLEYLTIQDNVRHAAAQARGGKLSKSQVWEIRKMYTERSPIPFTEMAKRFGVTPSVIRAVVKATSYANVVDPEGNSPRPIRRKLEGVDVYALHSGGQSMGSIARQYSVTTGAVSKAYHKMVQARGLG